MSQLSDNFVSYETVQIGNLLIKASSLDEQILACFMQIPSGAFLLKAFKDYQDLLDFIENNSVH